MDLEEEFKQRTEGLDKNSKEYKKIYQEIKDKLQAEAEAQQAQNRKRAMAMRIMELCSPTKSLIIPDLMKHSEEHLIEVGKAAKVLHDKLEKYGLII